MGRMGRVVLVTFFLGFPFQATLGASPKVQFNSSSSSGSEAISPADLTLVVSVAVASPVTVKYSITGGTATGCSSTSSCSGSEDFSLVKNTNYTVVIPAYALSANIPIPINNDKLVEPDETIAVKLISATIALGTRKTHTYSIIDNDPQISFNSAKSTGSEYLGLSNILVTLSSISDKTVTVDYKVVPGSGTTATEGTVGDYILSNGKLTFAPGVLAQNIDIENKLDNLIELTNETVTLQLSNPLGAPYHPTLGTFPTLTYTILDSAPRNNSNDYWADVALGQRVFTEITTNKVVPNKAFNPGGVVVDRSNTGTGTYGRAYVWDGGNNRILGFNLDDQITCAGYPNPGKACIPALVIGQSSDTDWGACNQDATMFQYPKRAPASAGTLCGYPPWGISPKELARVSSMAVDPNTGNLYVPDADNHRILIFKNPFTDTFASRTVADDVIGQDDFSGVYCNKGEYDLHGNTDGSYTPNAPTNASLCSIAISQRGFGVALDASGNLWVADGGNNRVLRFRKDPITGISKTADVVLGQPEFYTRGDGTDLSHMRAPSSLAFGPVVNGAQTLYVADTGFPGAPDNPNDRILVFNPPFAEKGQSAIGLFPDLSKTSTLANTFKLPFITGVTGVGAVDGLWVNSAYDWTTSAKGDVRHFAWDGTPKEILNKNLEASAVNAYGSVGVDKRGNVLVTASRDANDVLIYQASPSQQVPSTPSSTLLPPSKQYNAVTNNRLSSAHGIATARNQLYVADDCRILIWNSLDQLTDSKPADSFIGQLDFGSNSRDQNGGCYYQMKTDASNRLWVASKNRILVYETPLYTWNKPFKVIEGPIGVVGDNTAQPTEVSPDPDRWEFGLAPTADGNHLWISQPTWHRVLRIRNPLSNDPNFPPRVDIVLGQGNFSGKYCNRDPSIDPTSYLARVGGPGTYDKLCFPQQLSVDKKGYLYVSDHRAETQGNLRLLMFDTSFIPDNYGSAVYQLTAAKEFPYRTPKEDHTEDQHHATYETAFDSTNRMVVGYDGYVDGGKPFVGFYNDSGDHIPINRSTIPTGYLKDHMVYAFSTTFDAFDNLYVGDANRGKIFIYKNPFSTSPSATSGQTYPTTLTQVTAHITQRSDDTFKSCLPYSGINEQTVVVGYDTRCAVPDNSVAGLRFNGIDLPKGAKIDNAVIVYWPIKDAQNNYTGPLKLKISGALVANAADYPMDDLLTQTPTVTVPFDARENGKWQHNVFHSTPNLKSVVQQIIDNFGSNWQEINNSIAFLISNNGSTGYEEFIAQDYSDTNDDRSPYLFIQYHL